MTSRIVGVNGPQSLLDYLRTTYGAEVIEQSLVGTELTVTIQQHLDTEEEGQEDMSRYTYNENDQHPLHDPRWAEQFLEQSDLWCDANGEYLEVLEMESSHAQNAIVTVLKMAPSIALAVALGGDNLEGLPPDDRLELIADAPKARAWLLTTPLLKGLMVRASFSTAGRPPWATRRRLIRAQIR